MHRPSVVLRMHLEAGTPDRPWAGERRILAEVVHRVAVRTGSGSEVAVGHMEVGEMGRRSIRPAAGAGRHSGLAEEDSDPAAGHREEHRILAEEGREAAGSREDRVAGHRGEAGRMRRMAAL